VDALVLEACACPLSSRHHRGVDGRGSRQLPRLTGRALPVSHAVPFSEDQKVRTDYRKQLGH
jgi:hypothetical protein